MKNLFFYTCLVILFFNSCKENAPKSKVNQVKHDYESSITDPNFFAGKHKAKAMVFGVFHFGNPGLDTYKEKFPFEILKKQRQIELDILLDKLEEYKPTKILLEWNRIKKDSVANVQFQEYLNGTFSIDDKSNEVYQIGFKLAQRLGHNKVYCSDASADWFGVELDWDNYDNVSYLKSKGQYEKYSQYDFESFYELDDSLKTVQTLTEHLAWVNDPQNRLKDHQAYLTSIIEGAGDNYLGADNVARWYRRNLRIFSNAYDLTDFEKEERILLIYGAGHVWQLRQLFKDSPDFEYIEPNNYLKN